jgi:hypothetical protein
MGKLQGKRILGRSRQRWNNIKMDLKKREIKGLSWNDLAQDSEK